MTLFDPGPPLEPPPKLSTDARRTIRQRALLDGGTHPVTYLKLQPVELGRRCGNCQHLALKGGVAGRFYKCGALNGRYVTGGPATDLRLKWPACALWDTPDSSKGDPDAPQGH